MRMLRILNSRRLWFLFFALVILLLVMIGFEAWQTYRLAVDLKQTASELEALAGSDLERIDPGTAAALIHRARLDATGIQARIRVFAPLTNRLGWLPKIGPSIAAGAPLVDYITGLAIAGDELLTGLAPLLIDDAAGDTPSLSVRLMEVLQAAASHISSAESALYEASQAREAFTIDAVPASLRGSIEQVDRLFPLAQQALQVLRVSPTLLGDDGPRTYLLLAQNEDELRATGGFISGVGTLVLEQGQILSLSIGDSYAIDDFSQAYPTPPAPLQRYMLAGIWLVRDGNWSPDFPTAAQDVQELYRISTGSLTDGVIAFDQHALERVLEITGPVTLPSAPDAISAANIRDYMHQAWAPAPAEGFNREWWQGRKDFMGELGSALVEHIQDSTDRSALYALARTAVELMREKHLLIYIEDPAIIEILAAQGWDGALHPGDGDFMMVVDSNVGFNKVDPFIERAIEYQVDLSDPAAPLTSNLTISYSHTLSEEVACVHEASYGEGAYADMQARCYWDYVRVFTPGTSMLIGGDLPAVPGDWLISGEGDGGNWSQNEGEAGTMVYGGIFVLPAASQAVLRLSTLLPSAILQYEADGTLVYKLRLVKQPGAEGTPVTVTVIPPQGYVLVDASDWETLADGSLRWSGELRQDIDLELRLALVYP